MTYPRRTNLRYSPGISRSKGSAYTPDGSFSLSAH
jgi:hypothetical protein